MKILITGLAISLLGEGLWDHDWWLLVAAFAVAAIWPLIHDEVHAGDVEGRSA